MFSPENQEQSMPTLTHLIQHCSKSTSYHKKWEKELKGMQILGLSIETNVPLWWMLIMVEIIHGGRGKEYKGTYCTFPQFWYKSKTAQKVDVLKGKKERNKTDSTCTWHDYLYRKLQGKYKRTNRTNNRV